MTCLSIKRKLQRHTRALLLFKAPSAFVIKLLSVDKFKTKRESCISFPYPSAYCSYETCFPEGVYAEANAGSADYSVYDILLSNLFQ